MAKKLLLYFILIFSISALIIGGAFYLKSQQSRISVQPSPSATQGQLTATQSALLNTVPKYGDIKIETVVESTDSGKIKGKITVTNTSSQGLADLYYNVFLDTPQIPKTIVENGKEITVASSDLASYTESKTNFQLQPNENKTLLFEMEYSPHIKSGSYTLISQIITSLGTVVGISPPVKTNLIGSGDMLSRTDKPCVVTVSSKDYTPIEAPIANKGGLVEGKCTFTNTSSTPIHLTYDLTYAILHVSSAPKSEKKTLKSPQKITFAPNETRELNFPLPSDLEPQVYEAGISFLDNQGKPQAPNVYFRWTIKGESGRVLTVALDNDYYTQGQIAKVTTSVASSMDLFWGEEAGTKLADPKLFITINNDKNQLCGQKSYPITGDFIKIQEFTIDITVGKDCLNPNAKVQLFSGDKELASGDIKVLTSAKSLEPRGGKISLFLIVIPIVVFILIAYWIIKRKGKNRIPPTPISILLLFITFSFLLFYFGDKNTVNAVANINSYRVPANGPVRAHSDNWGGVTGNGYFHGSATWTGNTASISLWGTIDPAGSRCNNNALWFDIEGPWGGGNSACRHFICI